MVVLRAIGVRLETRAHYVIVCRFRLNFNVIISRQCPSFITTMTQENEAQLNSFIGRHRALLAKEREAEIERTSLLLSNCAPKLLEQKGLSLGGLSISNVSIGLGGKTCEALLI